MKTTSPTMKNMISTLMMMTDQLLLSGHLSQVTWLIFSQRCEQSLNNIQSTVPTHFHTLTVLRTSSPSNLRALFGFKGSPDSRCVDVHCTCNWKSGRGEDWYNDKILFFGRSSVFLEMNTVKLPYVALLLHVINAKECPGFHLTWGQRLQRGRGSNQSLWVPGTLDSKKHASLSIFVG